MYRTPDEKKIEHHLREVYETLFAKIGKFDGSYIAGGAITSLALDEKVNDYDFWFNSLAAWKIAVHQAETAAKKELASSDYFDTPTILVICKTEHALTFRIQGYEPTFQFVKSRVGSYDEVVEQFDFKHTHAAYIPADGDELGELFMVGDNTIDFIKEKVVVFAGILDYPTHTLSRIAKFASRGWKIPDSTIADLVREVWESEESFVQADLDIVGKKYHGRRYAGQPDVSRYKSRKLKRKTKAA